ncbi:hypothetical protein [Petrachloros mirabilis]
MSYRYTSVDIVIGVGMCAILFGALLFFTAANGTYQVAVPESLSTEASIVSETGLALLQPVIGHAVVDGAIFERRANELIAQSASEWNRATMAYQNFRSVSGGPFAAVMQKAETVPVDHQARVQGVMGQAIVNFTARGVRSGVLSADLALADYNKRMIRAVESRGQRLHDAFTSTWQATLGRNIVESFRTYMERVGALQERIGSALVQLAQGQYFVEQRRAANQTQLASLVTASIRSQSLSDRLTLLAAIDPIPQEKPVGITKPATWPEMSMGYFIVGGIIVAAIFFMGVFLSAMRREAKALADMRRNASKWVYRPAA